MTASRDFGTRPLAVEVIRELLWVCPGTMMTLEGTSVTVKGIGADRADLYMAGFQDGLKRAKSSEDRRF